MRFLFAGALGFFMLCGCEQELPEKLTVRGARMRTRPFLEEISGIGTLVSVEAARNMAALYEASIMVPEAAEEDGKPVPPLARELPESQGSPVVEPRLTSFNAVAQFEERAIENGLEEFEGLPLSLGEEPLVVKITFPEPPVEVPQAGSAVRALIVGEDQHAAPGILAFYDPNSQTGLAWVGFLKRPRPGTLINISVILRRHLWATFLPLEALVDASSEPYVNVYRPETRSVENVPVTIVFSESGRAVVVPSLPPGSLGLLDVMPAGELPEDVQIQSVDLFPDQKRIHWSGMVIDLSGDDS